VASDSLNAHLYAKSADSATISATSSNYSVTINSADAASSLTLSSANAAVNDAGAGASLTIGGTPILHPVNKKLRM
jgi:hypothetical protein